MPLMTLREKMVYLAAFIDTEGWVTYRRVHNGAGKLSRQIGFTNTNRVLLNKMVSFAKEAGLCFHVNAPPMSSARHSQRYNATLTGGREAFEKFHALVPLMHPDKVERLEAILSGYLSTDAAKRKRATAWRESMSYERQVEIAHGMVAARMAKRVESKQCLGRQVESLPRGITRN
jgi:hypothetical protein